MPRLTNKEVLLKQVLKDTQVLIAEVLPLLVKTEAQRKLTAQFTLNQRVIETLESRSRHGENSER